MLSLNKRKMFAILFTIISGVLVTSICPTCNERAIMLRYGRKYNNLEYAVQELSNFKTYNKTKQTIAEIHFTQPGFKEMLDLIQKRKVVHSKEDDITFIFIVKTGTGISLGGLFATPEYLLGVVANEKSESVSVMYENDVRVWIKDEKRDDLQSLSLGFLVSAVFLDWIADIPDSDYKKVEKALSDYLVTVVSRFRKKLNKLRT